MSNFLPSVQTFAKGTLATAAGLSTIGAGLLYYGQNYLIYPSAFPPGSRIEVPTPDAFGLEYQDLTLVTPDKVVIRSYLLLQKRELSDRMATEIESSKDAESDEEFVAMRPTVIMFHGNGGNHGHRIPLARIFYVRMRCNVLMLSYRGYGHSDGSPSEKGLKMDAQTALDYVKSHPILARTPTILYGQSIGGAVAIDLASQNAPSIKALVLENTFTSLPGVIPYAMPVLSPFSWLCHQKWDSLSKIPLIPSSIPFLMLSGTKDEVVPKEHMRELWDAVVKQRGGQAVPKDESEEGLRAASGLSKFIEFEEGHHNDTCVQPGYWTAVAKFISDVDQIRT